jgi:hypothetical protein
MLNKETSMDGIQNQTPKQEECKQPSTEDIKLEREKHAYERTDENHASRNEVREEHR